LMRIHIFKLQFNSEYSLEPVWDCGFKMCDLKKITISKRKL